MCRVWLNIQGRIFILFLPFDMSGKGIGGNVERRKRDSEEVEEWKWGMGKFEEKGGIRNWKCKGIRRRGSRKRTGRWKRRGGGGKVR